MKEDKKHNYIKDAMETMNEAEADRGLSIWFGAIFYYFLNLGKRPFEELYTKEYQTRNLWTGYFFKLVLIIAVIAVYVSISIYLDYL